MLRAREPAESLHACVPTHKLAAPEAQPMPRASWGGWPWPSGGTPSQADRVPRFPVDPRLQAVQAVGMDTPPYAARSPQVRERARRAPDATPKASALQRANKRAGGAHSFGSHLGNNSTSDGRSASENRYSRAAREERDSVRRTLMVALQDIGAAAQADAVRTCERRDILTDARPGPGQGAPILRVGKGGPGTWVPVVRARYCDHRLCPWCCVGRSQRYAETLVPNVAEHFKAKPAMATFTIDDRPGERLSAAAARILDAFKKLQRRKDWKAHVRGGLRSFEVTRNHAGGTWHVHLHVLLDVDWFAQEELLALWRECLTGDPEGWVRLRGAPPRQVGGVNIKRVDDAMEVCKYVAKGNEAVGWPPADLRELLAWMRGRRLLQTFGCLHGIKVPEEETPEVEEPPSDEAGINGRTGDVRFFGDCTWSREPEVEDEAWALMKAARAQKEERRWQADG